MKTIPVVLVDDHQMFREGLRRSISSDADIKIVGEAGDGHAALQQIQQLQPQIVVMDLGLPDGDGLSFAREILTRWPRTKVIVLSAVMDRRSLEEAIETGVSGYVLKVNAASELVRAIRAAANNETYFCPEVSAALAGGYKELLVERERQMRSALSGREAEVLKFLAEGRNTKEIARDLGLSVKTVETHRLRLMAKLNLHSVAELTKYAIRAGMTSL